MKNTSYNDIAEAIYETLQGKSGEEFSNISKEVTRFLYRRGMLKDSGMILSKLEKIMNKKEGRVKALVSSAESLSGGSKNFLEGMLKKRYGAKEVDIIESVQRELLGGVRVEVEDEVIDNTVSGKLKRLQAHLTN